MKDREPYMVPRRYECAVCSIGRGIYQSGGTGKVVDEMRVWFWWKWWWLVVGKRRTFKCSLYTSLKTRMIPGRRRAWSGRIGKAHCGVKGGPLSHTREILAEAGEVGWLAASAFLLSLSLCRRLTECPTDQPGLGTECELLLLAADAEGQGRRLQIGWSLGARAVIRGASKDG